MAAATRRGSSLCCCLWSRVDRDREAPSGWSAPYSFFRFYVTVFFKKKYANEYEGRYSWPIVFFETKIEHVVKKRKKCLLLLRLLISHTQLHFWEREWRAATTIIVAWWRETKDFSRKGGLATTVKDEGSTTRIILRNMRRKRELFIIKKNMK